MALTISQEMKYAEHSTKCSVESEDYMKNINSVACLIFLLIVADIIWDYQMRGSPSLLRMGYYHEGRIFQPTILTICFYCNLNKINSKCLSAGTALSNMKTSVLEKTTLVEVWYEFRAILGGTENSRLCRLLVLPGK